MQTFSKQFSIPPLFTGAVLLFWGWQTETFWFAAPMAFLLEIQWLIKSRWDFPDKSFYRISEIVTVLFVILGIYWLSKNITDGLFEVLRWSPALIFLLVLMQTYSTTPSFPLAALFMSLRKIPPHEFIGSQRVNILYAYLVLCLVSATVLKDPTFFYGLAFFTIWGLFYWRSPRFSLLIWFFLLSFSIGMGFVGQQGVSSLQTQIEEWAMKWLESRWLDRDPYKQRTAIGEIGELKLSGRILFRVKNARSPLLLRQSSYDTFGGQSWYTKNVKFEQLFLEKAGSWQLSEMPTNSQSYMLDIASYFDGGQGMLPLPLDTYKIDTITGLELWRNIYDGSIKLLNAPDFLHYQIHAVHLDHVNEPQPLPISKERFLEIPPTELETIQILANQLDLTNPLTSDKAKTETILNFFQNNFKYSLIQKRSSNNKTPLALFLTETRAGHCEFFATATALLLRAAGIPSRYATGYAVQEYSFLEKAYVVRRRHSHAWTMAYIDGHWQDIDTTPAVWAAEESEKAEWWESAYNLWAWMRYWVAEWQWRSADETTPKQWLLLIVVLLGWLIWRLTQYSNKKVIQLIDNIDFLELNAKGKDSEFYAMIAQLEKSYFARPTYESLTHWIERLSLSLEIKQLLHLHNRYRFDPKGLTNQEREQLAQQTLFLLNREIGKVTSDNFNRKR
jgi:transglutaminase-like putative cysteine protease